MLVNLLSIDPPSHGEKSKRIIKNIHVILAREEYGHHILVHSRKFPSLQLKFCIDWCVEYRTRKPYKNRIENNTVCGCLQIILQTV